MKKKTKPVETKGGNVRPKAVVEVEPIKEKTGKDGTKVKKDTDPKLERTRQLCAYMVETGMARTICEIGKNLGYKHHHAFYTMLYQKKILSPKLILRLAATYPTVNISYITDGNGPMISENADAVAKVAPRRIDRLLLYLTMSDITIKDALHRLEWDVFMWYSFAKSKDIELSDRQVEQVLKVFPELSRSWLSSGKGNMLKNNVDATKRDMERKMAYLTNRVTRLEKENALLRKRLNDAEKC